MLGSFIKTYAHASIGTSYCHTALVSHGGVLIGFSLDSDQQFWYTVLDLENDKIDSPIDVNYWLKEPVPLLFPKEITQVGYRIKRFLTRQLSNLLMALLKLNLIKKRPYGSVS